MNILNMLKLKKKEEFGLPPLEGMDIPPPPPLEDIHGMDFPPLPPSEYGLELPPLPPLEESPEFDIRKVSGFSEEFGLPSLEDESKEEEIEMPSMPIERRPVMQAVKEKPARIISAAEEEPKEAAVEEELTEEAEQPLFVRVDQYKNILEGISSIKSKLKSAEDVIGSLNDIKNTKDKEFEKWRAELESIERKLSYIDKTLFEVS